MAGLLVWAGCSSSDSGGGSSTTVDPGGTYGAEISVRVVGRGSVTSKVTGIACPGQCSARYAFKSAADVGATTGITLTARVTADDKVRFAGWKLEAIPLATRGRGPDNCNPVTRDTAVPSIDTNAADVTLPFGTVQGRSPAGQEAPCAGYTDVPTAYSLVATFEDIPVPDAGVDADDGGGPDFYYDRPIYNTVSVADAVGKEVGIPYGSSSYLYWRWTMGNGASGISRGYTSSGLTPSVVVGPTAVINQFDVNYHVAYQTADNVIHVIQAGGNLAVDVTGAPACVALSTDASYVYCRTASTGANGGLYYGSVSGGAVTQAANNLPTGNDLWAEVSGLNNIYFSDTAGGLASQGRVLYITSKTAADSGLEPVFNQLVGTQTGPTAVHGTSSRLFWLQAQAGGAAGSAALGKTGVPTTYSAFPLTTGVNRIAMSSSDSTYFWYATANEIDRAYYTGSITPLLLRDKLNTVGGLAVDSSYVYWTTADGRVYRHFRN